MSFVLFTITGILSGTKKREMLSDIFWHHFITGFLEIRGEKKKTLFISLTFSIALYSKEI